MRDPRGPEPPVPPLAVEPDVGARLSAVQSIPGALPLANRWENEALRGHLIAAEAALRAEGYAACAHAVATVLGEWDRRSEGFRHIGVMDEFHARCLLDGEAAARAWLGGRKNDD
jgi:hypothetical protein